MMTLGASFGAYFAILGCTRGKGALAVGDAFPAFDLPALDGARHTLSGFVGKPLLINLWATWCPPCRAEMADLNALYKDVSPGELEIVTISVDEDANMVKEVVRNLRFSCPVLLDAGQRWAMGALRPLGLPVTYLLDRNATIREIFLGPRPWTSPAIRADISDRVQIP